MVDGKRLANIYKVWTDAVPLSLQNAGGVLLTKTWGLKLSEAELKGLSHALRFNCSTPFHGDVCEKRDDNPKYAVVAAFHSPKGELAQVYRIYTRHDGSRPNIDGSAKFMPSAGLKVNQSGGAVRLFKAADSPVIGVSRDIETALAVHRQFDIPVWATLTDANTPFVVVPKTVHRVIIFVLSDSRDSGDQAAGLLRKRMMSIGRPAEIKYVSDTSFVN